MHFKRITIINYKQKIKIPIEVTKIIIVKIYFILRTLYPTADIFQIHIFIKVFQIKVKN